MTSDDCGPVEEGEGFENEWEPDPDGELIARDESTKVVEGVELKVTLSYYRTPSGGIAIKLDGATGRMAE